MKTNVYVLCAMVIRGFTRNCDSTCVINIEANGSRERDAEQLEERVKPETLLKRGRNGHVLGLGAGKCLGGLFFRYMRYHTPMVEPAIARDGHTIFRTCGPVSITVAMELARPSGAPIMQVVIHSAGKVPKDAFGGCKETWGWASEVLRQVLYSMGDVWVSADGQIEKFPDEFGVEGHQVRDIGQLRSHVVTEERVIQVHRQRNWMAVGEAILVEDVKDVLSLMYPQFPGAPVMFELNAKVLHDGSHVRDAKSCMQATLCLAEEKTVIATSHTVIDVPG